MAADSLSVEHRGAIAWLNLGVPGPLTLGDVERLAAALATAADDGSTRVAVLGGAGAFARTWDGSALRAGNADPAELRRLSATLQAIAETPLPTIALIDGDATGAGLDLALVCDVRLAADDARFGFPEAGAGQLPLGGGAARLARLAGRSTAARVLLTGDTLNAGEALACGLVSGVYAGGRLMAEAERLAAVIAARGPIAVQFAKEAVARGPEMPLDQALRFETDLTIILQTTGDRAEGVQAFVEKREPRFRGE